MTKRKRRPLALWLFMALVAGRMLCEAGLIAPADRFEAAFGVGMAITMLIGGAAVAASEKPWWRQ